MVALPENKQVFGMRGEVLDAVAAYRNPGVNLGRLLNEVALGGDYKEWGYDDFEAYCWEELGLKKAKARELMTAYNYLKKHRSDMIVTLETGGRTVTFPSSATLAALDKAERDDAFSDEDLNDMKFQAFSQPITDNTEREVKRRAKKPRKDVPIDEKQRREVRSAARKFKAMVERAEFVPETAKDKIGEGIAEIEALV